MNSKFERSAIYALCVGVIFCLATIVTPAQDSQQTAQDSQQPAQGVQQTTQDVQQGVQQTAQNVQQGVQQQTQGVQQQTQGVQQGVQQQTQGAQTPAPTTQQQAQVVQVPVRPCSNPDCHDELDDAKKGSRHAAEVFKDFTEVRDKIPPDILCKAVAIGVFKGVFNVAFAFGWRSGNGAITVRQANGAWSAPVYYKMKGGNFGWQIGVQSTDFVLVFMSQESIKDLANDEFDMSLDANAVIGPIFGARAAAGHPDFPKSKTVFVYARSNGAYIGAVIDGAKIYARNEVNRDMYGMNALDLLSDTTRIPTMCANCLPAGLNDFPQTVAAVVPPQVIYVQPVAVAVQVQPQPQPQPKPTAAATPTEPPAPTRVIIVTEEPPPPVEEPPTPTPSGSRRRAHKMKT